MFCDAVMQFQHVPESLARSPSANPTSRMLKHVTQRHSQTHWVPGLSNHVLMPRLSAGLPTTRRRRAAACSSWVTKALLMSATFHETFMALGE